MNLRLLFVWLVALGTVLTSCEPETIDVDLDSEKPTDGTHGNDKDNGSTSEGNEGSTPTEIAVDTTDTYIIYASSRVIIDIQLSECPDPIAKYSESMHPYRMPTRLEAYTLKNIKADLATGNQRCLCYDDPNDAVEIGSTQLGTGNYYTFVWGSGITPTKAGQKTKYCIVPIRTEPLPGDSVTDTPPDEEQPDEETPDDGIVDIPENPDDNNTDNGNEGGDGTTDDDNSTEDEPENDFNINNGISIGDEADGLMGD